MRGIIFLIDLLLLSYVILAIISLLYVEEVQRESYYRLACDIAMVIESKSTVTLEDVNFILKFVPSYSYFEINGRVYYVRDGKKDTVFSCRIGNTTVKIGI